MTLLTIFSQQRKLWRSQSNEKSAEHLTGGLAALDQAEAAFKATLIYNAHQQLADTQRELEEVSYQLSVARKQIKHLEAVRNIPSGRVKSQLSHAQTTKLFEQQRVKAYRARKALRAVVALANHPNMDRDKKLRKIVELVNKFLTSPRGQSEGGEDELGGA